MLKEVNCIHNNNTAKLLTIMQQNKISQARLPASKGKLSIGIVCFLLML